MTAPLHERLAEAAKAAEQGEWIGKPREDAEDAVYIATPIGPDVQFKHVAIAVQPHHSKRTETTAFLIAAQPSKVAKLCEQVRVMKEALEGAYALAIGHAATYKFQQGLDDMHPTHQDVLKAVRSALEMVRKP